MYDDDGFLWQIVDATIVRDVEVTAIDASCLSRLDDPAAVFLRASLIAEFGRVLLEPVGKVRFKPVAALGADTQISAGLAVDPA